MIYLEVNGIRFEANSPLEAFAFTTAVQFYDLNEEQALQVANLSYRIYNETLYEVYLTRLVDQLCEKIDDYLSLEFLEVMEDVLQTVAEFDL